MGEDVPSGRLTWCSLSGFLFALLSDKSRALIPSEAVDERKRLFKRPNIGHLASPLQLNSHAVRSRRSTFPSRV